jgi:PST family polysaccharide transporter
LISVLVGGAAGLILALTGAGVWSLVAQQLVGALIGSVTLWYSVAWRPRLSLSLKHAGHLYEFGLKVTLNNLLWVFSQRMDQMVVGYAFGSAVLGAYSLAWRLIQMLLDVIAGPVARVMFPAFSRLSENPTSLQRTFLKTTQLLAIVCFAAFAALGLMAPHLVQVGFGPRWAAVVPYVQALAVYGALAGTLSTGHGVFMATGRPGTYSLQFVQLASLTTIACVAAVPYGPVALAWFITGAMLVHSCIYVFVLRAVSGVSPISVANAIAPPALAATLMVVTGLLLRSHGVDSWLWLMLSIAIAALVYVMALLLLAPQALEQVAEMVKRTAFVKP